MLVMSKGALSAKQAETYYQEKYSQDDYYTEHHRVAGQWFGRGAEALGLADEVSPCLLYTSPSPRDLSTSRMPSSA